MGSARWRFLDTGPNTGAFNMECDVQLARERQQGMPDPVLRFYRWQPWAVSLGYHQNIGEIDADACAREGIDVVRRPTGGRAILHGEELTYSVVMPAGRNGVLQMYNAISRAIVRGLRRFGVDADLQKTQPDFPSIYRHPSSIPCFTSSARYEIEWRGRKLVGSAQRRYSGSGADVVLQHGSILCGPAHRRLADLLVVDRQEVRAQVRAELTEKTVDLAEIIDRRVVIEELSECVRRGFEEEWNVDFAMTD